MALGDRGSGQEAEQTCAGQGFRAACAGPRAFCLGLRCWGVGDGKEDLPGRNGGWQRRKGMSQCGTAGDARVGQIENFRRWALLFCGARRSCWRLESLSTGNGEPALLAGIGSVTTRGKSLPPLPKSLPSLCPSPSYGPSSPSPSPGPGVGRLSDPGHCCAFPAPPALPRPVTPASPRGPRRISGCSQGRRPGPGPGMQRGSQEFERAGGRQGSCPLGPLPDGGTRAGVEEPLEG